ITSWRIPPMPSAVSEAVVLTPVACIRAYGDLIEVLKQEKAHLGLTNEQIDMQAGYADRLTQKLLTWPPKPYSRGLGGVTVPIILEVLGLALLVVRVAPHTEFPPVDRQQFKSLEA